MSEAKETERRLTYRIDAMEERIATLEKQVSELTNKKETGAPAYEENKEGRAIRHHSVFCACKICRP